MGMVRWTSTRCSQNIFTQNEWLTGEVNGAEEHKQQKMIAYGEALMTLELSEEIKTPRARNHLSENEKERFWVVPLFLGAAAIFQLFNNWRQIWNGPFVLGHLRLTDRSSLGEWEVTDELTLG